MFTLICGRCRAGKTTYSKRYQDVIHLDDVSKSGRERYPKVKEMVKQHIATDDVVVEGVYETSEFRKDLLSVCKQSPKRCIWLDTSLDVIQQRMGQFIVVPRHFEPPTLAEGWDEIIIIRGNDEQCINRQTED